MTEQRKREWPGDYVGGPIGQAFGWAIVAVLLILAVGAFVG